MKQIKLAHVRKMKQININKGESYPSPDCFVAFAHAI
jgi:hypothetical protein